MPKVIKSKPSGRYATFTKSLTWLKWITLILVVSVVALLASAPFYIYHQFNAAAPIAKIEFSPIGEQEYTATLYSGNLCSGEDFVIYGDQLQLDASFIKWQGWAVLLGFESKYKLDRLSGRYRDITEQGDKPKKYYDIAPEVWFDIFDEDKLEGQSGLFIDSQYGSSVYVDINPELTYIIYRTEDGLIAKSYDRTNAEFVDGILTIRITNPCGDQESLLSSITQKTNTMAVKLVTAIRQL